MESLRQVAPYMSHLYKRIGQLEVTAVPQVACKRSTLGKSGPALLPDYLLLYLPSRYLKIPDPTVAT